MRIVNHRIIKENKEMSNEPIKTKVRLSSQSNFNNSFKIELLTNDNTIIGSFMYYSDPEDGVTQHSVQVTPNFKGKGYGKELLLRAIKVANDYEIGFYCDSSMTAEQKNVYDSLERNGLIQTTGLGGWILTDDGEDKLDDNLIQEDTDKITRDIVDIQATKQDIDRTLMKMGTSGVGSGYGRNFYQDIKIEKVDIKINLFVDVNKKQETHFKYDSYSFYTGVLILYISNNKQKTLTLKFKDGDIKTIKASEIYEVVIIKDQTTDRDISNTPFKFFRLTTPRVLNPTGLEDPNKEDKEEETPQEVGKPFAFKNVKLDYILTNNKNQRTKITTNGDVKFNPTTLLMEIKTPNKLIKVNLSEIHKPEFYGKKKGEINAKQFLKEFSIDSYEEKVKGKKDFVSFDTIKKITFTKIINDLPKVVQS